MAVMPGVIRLLRHRRRGLRQPGQGNANSERQTTLNHDADSPFDHAAKVADRM
jgi:hypothetical protein